MMYGFEIVLFVCIIVLALGLFSSSFANEMNHPVYPVTESDVSVDQLKKAVAPVMALSEDEMVALVPDKTGFRFMGCPNCDAGTQEGQLVWSIEDPHHVMCRFCEMVFPNEKFPEDQEMKFENPVGVDVTYPYWEDDTGYKYLFSGKGWREARVYFSRIAQDLGELYQLTGEMVYARRAALILDAFARYYPGFLVSQDLPHRPKGFALEPPYPNMGGKWGRWRHDEMPTDLVFAYDSIYNSGALETLSEEVGVDVKKRIEQDFFYGAIRQDAFHEPNYSNAAPRIYEGYVTIGRVLGDPALVHKAVQYSQALFEQKFYEEGFWFEGSVGYHNMTMRGMDRVFEAMKGYTDPPGYVDEVDGTRFDDLDAERDIGIIRRAQRILEICRYPDGRSLPVHDNWARYQNLQVPEKSESTLLPGVGHAWLGQGSGDGQVQLHLHFSGGYGHEHADNMNMSFFAKGHELLPDLGYTHTRHRLWSTGTLSHNTVVIDEERQYTRGNKGPSDGRLLAFETGVGMVQWVEASGEKGYPDIADLYRRGLLLVQANDTDVYAVDMFWVMGGKQHDWALHGSADADGSVDVNVPLKPFGENLLPGVKVRYPEGESDRGDAEGRNMSYAYFQNVSQGSVDGDVVIRFDLDDSSVGIRSHVLQQQGTELFVGDALSFRRANEDDALLEKYRMPIVLLRDLGDAPLTNTFAAVHEPFDGAPFVDEVNLHRADDEAVVLSVKHNGVTDHFVRSVQGGVVEVGDLKLDGELGFVRERDGVVEAMGLWGGTTLHWREEGVTGEGVFEGTVTGTLRKDAGDVCDGLVVSGDMPEGALQGATAIVTFADGSTRGCRIDHVASSSEGTRLVLFDDPGFVVDAKGAEHVFFPLRKIDGAVKVLVRPTVFKKLDDKQ